MKRTLRFACYSAMLLSLAGAISIPLQAQLVVTNEDGNTVTLIDANAWVKITDITVGGGPSAVAFKPDGSRAYVTNTDDGTVSVIDMVTKTVVATITVGNDPTTIVVTPNGLKAYVTNSDDGTVSVINLATNLVSTTIVLPLTAPDVSIPTPQFVAVTPDGSRVYVANEDGVNSYFIDTATDVPTPFNIGIIAETVGITPDGTKAYFGGHLSTNTATGKVQVVNIPLNTLGTLIGVPASPHAVAITPNGLRAYTTNEDNGTVSVINTATDDVVATIPGFSEPARIAFSPDGSIMYVSDTGDVKDGDPKGGFNAVIQVYTSTNTWVPFQTALQTGDDPEGLAFSPTTTFAPDNIPALLLFFFN